MIDPDGRSHSKTAVPESWLQTVNKWVMPLVRMDAKKLATELKAIYWLRDKYCGYSPLSDSNRALSQ